MNFRQAEAADINQVVCLQGAMLEEMESMGGEPLVDKAGITCHLRERFFDNLTREDYFCLLSESDEGKTGPIGLIEASIIYPDKVFKPTRRLHIHAIYVLPAFRGQGVGKSLMESSVRWGKEKGCLEIDLNVLVNNPALQLYKEMGFHPFEANMRLIL
jgi:ribosomal protein S18 acetylase RimI-like enzyme